MKDYSFGNFICALREGAGLSQFQLGALIGVSDKAVSKWENGAAKPGTKRLPLLAAILGVSVDELLSCVSGKMPCRKERTDMEKNLWAKAAQLLQERCGDDLTARSRFETEKLLFESTDVILYLALLGQWRQTMKAAGIPAVSRGELGCCLTAWLLGATDVNPLPPHTRCPKCKTIHYHPEIRDGFDLIPTRCGCGSDLLCDGHHLPIEGFAYSMQRGAPSFDLQLSKHAFTEGMTQLTAMLREFFYPVRIEFTQDAVEDDVPPAVEKVLLLPKGHSIADQRCEKLCISSQEYANKYMGFPSVTLIGCNMTKGADEFFFAPQVQKQHRICTLWNEALEKLGVPALPDAEPPCFSSLLQAQGLLISSGVWKNNGDMLVKNDPSLFMSLGAFREDLYHAAKAQLQKAGIADSGIAFAIMNDARLGRFAFKPEKSCLSALADLGFPDWYIEHVSKILYLFPKAHCISLLMAEL